MRFGQIVRDLRTARGIGLKRAAPDVGVSYTYLSKLENDIVRPSDDVVIRLARYFEYDEGELLLAAGRIPADILRALQDDPAGAIEYLRERFGRTDGRPEARTAPQDHRSAR